MNITLSIKPQDSKVFVRNDSSQLQLKNREMLLSNKENMDFIHVRDTRMTVHPIFKRELILKILY
jgi:hypothetical protein